MEAGIERTQRRACGAASPSTPAAQEAPRHAALAGSPVLAQPSAPQPLAAGLQAAPLIAESGGSCSSGAAAQALREHVLCSGELVGVVLSALVSLHAAANDATVGRATAVGVSLARVACVCRAWRAAAACDQVWRAAFLQRWPAFADGAAPRIAQGCARPLPAPAAPLFSRSSITAADPA